jgi:hypothetical protein
VFEIYFDETRSATLRPRSSPSRVPVRDCAGGSWLGRPDDEQLKFATETNRVLVTRNYAHFIQLRRLHGRRANARRNHCCCPPTDRRQPQTRALLNIAAVYSQDEMRNKLLFLGNWV